MGRLAPTVTGVARLRTRLAPVVGRATARQAAGVLAVLAGVVAFVVGHEVFPYYSFNHDEAVYLQQAAMLLDGKLAIEPPVVDALRPWFFVADGTRLYPKYAPVPASMFAGGMVLGSARLALAVIAAAVVALTYATVAEAFDRRRGLVAAALLVATPLFLVQSSVFLPYVPTLAWLLLFSWAYLRADRTHDVRWAALAGLGVAVAFFARPYTAVLFAAPFVAHAGWTMWQSGWPAVRRQGTTGAVGLLGVGAALAYNAVVTGDPLVFPYQAFSPQDGPGFGWRELWGHGIEYTPELAVESARIALTAYVSEWSVAPPLGVLAALAGLGLLASRGRRADPRRLALAGLVPTIVAGQLYFWGTLNAIGTLDDPGLGLMGHLGPYYHLVLVIPTAAFGAHALVTGWERLAPRFATLDGRRARAGLAGVALVLALVAGATAVAGVGGALADNRQVTDAYETAYEPIEETDDDRALVFLPTPHGPWLAHPFQYLHNGPEFGGPTVYAQDRQVFAVLAAFPDRTPYRYSYRGEWVPVGGQTVAPRLEQLTHVRGEAVRLDVTAGLQGGTSGAIVRVATGAGANSSGFLAPDGDELTLSTTVRDDRAIVTGPALNDSVTVPVERRDTLNLTLAVDGRGLGTFAYELGVPLQRDNGTVAALTPRQQVCTDVRLCDEGAAYVPGAHGPGISLETSLTASDRSAAAD